MKHLKYLKYVLRHKWFVALQCFRHGMILRGLFHDMSKFRIKEWFPYSEYFYGSRKDKNEFDLAWLSHQNINDHHWQRWVLLEDSGVEKLLPMSKKARLEMICDWYGAGKAITGEGWNNVKSWYNNNKQNMRLHPETRMWVEEFLNEKQE